MENINPNDFSLSDDHQENLRMENEILRLKLKAELGAESHSLDNVPTEIENEFLKHILAFEHASAGGMQIKVYDWLEKPDFKLADELNNVQIEKALEEIIGLLTKKQIAIDFCGKYDSRIKYQFITQELFEQQIDEISIPGMFTHFIYEEFHPNHKLDIENRAMEFLSQWFDRGLNEQSWELSDSFILPDGQQLTRNSVAKRLKSFFESYTAFTDGNIL